MFIKNELLANPIQPSMTDGLDMENPNQVHDRKGQLLELA